MTILLDEAADPVGAALLALVEAAMASRESFSPGRLAEMVAGAAEAIAKPYGTSSLPLGAAEALTENRDFRIVRQKDGTGVAHFDHPDPAWVGRSFGGGWGSAADKKAVLKRIEGTVAEYEGLEERFGAAAEKHKGTPLGDTFSRYAEFIKSKVLPETKAALGAANALTRSKHDGDLHFHAVRYSDSRDFVVIATRKGAPK